MYALIVGLLFVAVALLLRGAWLLWEHRHGPRRSTIRQRIRALSGETAPDHQSIRKQRLLSNVGWVQQLLLRLPGSDRLDRLLAQADTPLNVARFIGVSLATGLAGCALLLWLALPAWGAATGGAVAIGIPWWRVCVRRRRRLELIEQQLPAALDLICRALRAGHALPPAIEMVADEMAPPLSHEFRIVFDEVNHGIAMSDALKSLSYRVPTADIGYFVVAVLIQRETGGNLTLILQNIAAIVRQRLRLFGQIKVLSAEGRLSAWILGLLPFGLAAVINLLNPGFMTLLWVDPAGQQMLKVLLVLMAAGVFWIRRIIRIKV